MSYFHDHQDYPHSHPPRRQFLQKSFAFLGAAASLVTTRVAAKGAGRHVPLEAVPPTPEDTRLPLEAGSVSDGPDRPSRPGSDPAEPLEVFDAHLH